ncbi:hypothetical protein GUITHDRAFT_104214 [Guillardia theta CCMP2712]|uniref:Uncharacterized protein n=1 Tax=Guillardia theta (strain CCMP2712) TaxID=905079 RepID=L1JNI8_GUITC|nr:hypothetical protein GUITHDRAFT_104214 [Guillardia theta CCMP2712]EKX49819.1 hypothetical protein GUITHDRAFT_104214 [Guillardia theta CCMP2712]|eukprot:XP_005836799.1 hypothetical protein GUITHDRAFT_104214 [Guillardia theta CCMP2712]
MCLHWILSFTIIVIPLILSIVIAYLMICWAMLLFRPKELGEYEQFSNQDSPYGTRKLLHLDERGRDVKRQDKTRQDKTRQDKTGYSNTKGAAKTAS